MKRFVVGAALFAFSLLANAATEVIPLNFRTADDLLPVVQSTLGNDGRVLSLIHI